ncbi:FAD-dependent oxidoreductase [Streptomyces sp. NPDC046759]|uniref:FAD-dependent oxidoreductase n=1 Tax=Streptomyces sp. NPDC046759 TaxID=3155019 RepID=UPI0033D308AE
MSGTDATRVLVIGGGIAGTAAALGLHKAGCDVTVYEAHPDTAEDIGAFLTLASNGMRALAELDATDAVAAVGFPLTSLRLLDGDGTELTHAPLGEVGDPALRYRCVRRGELNAALQAEAIRRGIRLCHGARLAAVTDGPHGVTARFADGGTAHADLLVGADGLHSTVRGILTPQARPVYAGQRVFYGYSGTGPGVDGTGVITFVRGSGTTFGYAASPDGETYWFARVSTQAPPAGGPAHLAPWHEELLPLLRKDSTPAADIVAASRGPVMVTDATEMPLGTPWHSGHMLLIGDAAHAASPATGQGASMALEDAVVLAKALRDLPGAPAAFAAYERHRRARVEHNITVSGGLSRGIREPSRPAPVVGRPAEPDETLIRQLAWHSPLPAAPPEQP